MKGADVAMASIVQYNDWLEEEVKSSNIPVSHTEVLSLHSHRKWWAGFDTRALETLLESHVTGSRRSRAAKSHKSGLFTSVSCIHPLNNYHLAAKLNINAIFLFILCSFGPRKH